MWHWCSDGVCLLEHRRVVHICCLQGPVIWNHRNHQVLSITLDLTPPTPSMCFSFFIYLTVSPCRDPVSSSQPLFLHSFSPWHPLFSTSYISPFPLSLCASRSQGADLTCCSWVLTKLQLCQLACIMSSTEAPGMQGQEETEQKKKELLKMRIFCLIVIQW